MIYLDYTANTPADPAVLNAFIAAEQRYIANPNSTHIAGQQARAEMDRVTSSIAQHLGVQPAEIISTSGASEANNPVSYTHLDVYKRQGYLPAAVSPESMTAPVPS